MSINLILAENKCCGCGACSTVCPKKAISMVPNEKGGFIFPLIDNSKCIECGACEKVCQYHNPCERNSVKQVYASAVKDDRILKSSSGGAFVELATQFIRSGGVVCGVAMSHVEDQIKPMHMFVDDISDIEALQGSKYAQSDMTGVFSKVRSLLSEDREVLFSGTPCQVAGLKSYLKKSYSNLYTVDMICHGVPSSKMFNDYLDFLGRKMDGEIIDYKFRDKQLGWGINMRVYLKKKDGRIVEKVIPPEMSSYFSLFLKSHITRESCIGCCYASANRTGDITLGDYWGVNTAHPEAVNTNRLDYNKGVSCVFVNTDKGRRLFEKYGFGMECVESDYKVAVRFNGQAEKPVEAPLNRNMVLEAYAEKGYPAVDKFYWDLIGMKKFIYYVKNTIPRSFRVKIKRLLKK